MRYKNLFKTLLIVNFAKESVNPFNSALIRILTAYLLAFIFGRYLQKPVVAANLPSNIPLSVVLAITLTIAFFLSGFLFLSISANNSYAGKTGVFKDVVRLMPVPKVVRWIINILPGLILIGIIDIFGSMILIAAAKSIQVNTLLLIGSWTLGLISGFSFSLAPRPKKLVHKGSLFVFVMVASFYLLDKLLVSESQVKLNTLAILIICLLLLPIASLYFIYANGLRIVPGIKSQTEKQIIPNILPHSAWFLVKIWRNIRVRSSFFLALLLNFLTAAVIVIKHKSFEDPFGILLFGAILAATFACEIRGVMRRYFPPEMVLLKGIKGIVKSEIASVILIGILIGAPVMFAVHGQADNGFAFAVYYLVLQSYASLAGLLASTILVPGAGETGSQFFASILASTAVLLLPKAGHFTDVDYSKQFPYWLIAGIAVGIVIYITEIIRRYNHGRSRS